jgi:hypothetical protein
MPNNDKVFLDALLARKKTEEGSLLPDDEFFELFTFEQILKDFDLSGMGLQTGHVDGGNDGGIDGFYFFADGRLIDEPLQDIIAEPRKYIELELYLIQSKMGAGFEQTPVNAAIATINDLFDFSKDRASLTPTYNESLLEGVFLFREALTQLQTKYPKLRVWYVYACKGETANVAANVTPRLTALTELIQQKLTASTAEYRLLGAKELLDLARQVPTYNLTLPYEEMLVRGEEHRYVLLVRLDNYARFCSDNNGLLRRHLFESNVRDFAGEDVEVNKKIRQTLDERRPKEDLDFWWLNNGVTIIASDASLAPGRLTLENVEIVNGLQTTEILHAFVAANAGITDERCVLVKIVVTQDAETKERIISATNSQTPIQPALFRATDAFQRNLEQFFFGQGWYYDRRKNHYRNQGKPSRLIVSIQYLAQSVLAIVLRQPDQARARPTTSIKKDDDYNRIFNTGWPPGAFLSAARLMRDIENVLRDSPAAHPRSLRTNAKFHIGMLVAMRVVGKAHVSPTEVAGLYTTTPTRALIEGCADQIIRDMSAFAAGKGWNNDRAAKSAEYSRHVVDAEVARIAAIAATAGGGAPPVVTP